jgi:hypothetical protein
MSGRLNLHQEQFLIEALNALLHWFECGPGMCIIKGEDAEYEETLVRETREKLREMEFLVYGPEMPAEGNA